jgi:hypothetical protein
MANCCSYAKIPKTFCDTIDRTNQTNVLGCKKFQLYSFQNRYTPRTLLTMQNYGLCTHFCKSEIWGTGKTGINFAQFFMVRI